MGVSMNDFLSQPTQDRWGVTKEHLFDESLQENTIIFPDLPVRLQRFLDFKRSDPLRNRYGKHDTRLAKKLVGFWHAHLRDDAVLIYNLKDRAINLVFIAKHSDMEGKRLLLLSD